MSDHSLVKDDQEVHGFWVEIPSNAKDPRFLADLAIREGLPIGAQEAFASGRYRIVNNTHDSRGGCFAMLGSALAPGEEADSEVFWKEPTREQGTSWVEDLRMMLWVLLILGSCIFVGYLIRSVLFPIPMMH